MSGKFLFCAGLLVLVQVKVNPVSLRQHEIAIVNHFYALITIDRTLHLINQLLTVVDFVVYFCGSQVPPPINLIFKSQPWLNFGKLFCLQNFLPVNPASYLIAHEERNFLLRYLFVIIEFLSGTFHSRQGKLGYSLKSGGMDHCLPI